jgi:hypothetical protein
LAHSPDGLNPAQKADSTEGGGGWWSDDMPLPKGALQTMFPEKQTWSLLHTLKIEVLDLEFDVTDWCVDLDDITRIYLCLPALHTLHLVHVVKNHDTVMALQFLRRRLEVLKVGGKFFDDVGALLVSTQLTQLQVLEWKDTDITPRGLQMLTSLTNLYSLNVFDCPCVGNNMLKLRTSPEVGEGAGILVLVPWGS